MNTFTRIAIIASIVTFAGCEAPSESDVADDPIAGQASSTDRHDRMEAAPPGIAFGQLNDEDGIGLVGATICIFDGNRCDVSDEDGTWEIGGIESGMSEMLQINAAGYIPTIIPMDMGGRDIWVNVNMVPTDGLRMPKGQGAVRLVDVSAPSASVGDKVSQVRFTRDDGEGGVTSMALGKRVQVAVMDAGIAQATVQQMVPHTWCQIVRGSAGRGAVGASVPVISGHITQIAHRCLISKP